MQQFGEVIAMTLFWVVGFKRATSQKSFIRVCLQIDPESDEWRLSARSVDLKLNSQWRMIIGI